MQSIFTCFIILILCTSTNSFHIIFTKKTLDSTWWAFTFIYKLFKWLVFHINLFWKSKEIKEVLLRKKVLFYVFVQIRREKNWNYSKTGERKSLKTISISYKSFELYKCKNYRNNLLVVLCTRATLKVSSWAIRKNQDHWGSENVLCVYLCFLILKCIHSGMFDA